MRYRFNLVTAILAVVVGILLPSVVCVLSEKNLRNDKEQQNNEKQCSTVYVAMERYKDSSNDNFMVLIYSNEESCGGILVTRDFVLTAAHCVSNTEVGMLIGTTDINPGKEFKSKSVIIHEHYNSATKENDIALIQLSEPVQLSKSIGLARLFSKKLDLKDRSTLKAIGWGNPNSSDGLNDTLLTKEVFLDLTVNCNNYKNKNSIIFTDGQNGPFEGDSGGPLLDQNFVIGIISADVCNKKSYSFVPFFYAWIFTHIRQKSEEIECFSVTEIDKEYQLWKI